MTADEIISSPRARVDPRTRATMPREATVATLARSKTPLSHFPEFAALKAELKELRDAAERKESREAKALRRRLTEQSERQAALSDAFTSLSDAILDEMETLKREMRELRADQEATARWRRATTRDVRALQEEARASVVRRGAEEMGESSPPASRLEQLCGVEDRVEALTRRVEACEAEARDASARRVDDLDLTRAALEAARRDQARSIIMTGSRATASARCTPFLEDFCRRAFLSAQSSLSISALDAFRLRLTPLNSTPTFARTERRRPPAAARRASRGRRRARSNPERKSRGATATCRTRSCGCGTVSCRIPPRTRARR